MVSFDICEGNPGAFQFLMEAYEIDMFRAEKCFSRMDYYGIHGAALYMLWNDCCDRSTGDAMDAMENMDIGELMDHINLEGGRGIHIKTLAEKEAEKEK